MEQTEDFNDLLLPHPRDKEVLAAAFEALMTESINVLIVGEEDFHVDACFLTFYASLKAMEGLQLHRMMSPKIEDTVDLFNSILSELTIEQARNERAEHRHVIIMPEFGPNAGKEWMACEALVKTFPGANVTMLSFSTIDAHDAATLRQISLKANNRLFNLGNLDLACMSAYLNESKEKESIKTLLPALENTIWHTLALEIAGEVVEDGSVANSVADYEESIDNSIHAVETKLGLEKNPGSIETGIENAVAQGEISGRWSRSLSFSKSIIMVIFISLFSSAFLLLVAGALDPSLWQKVNVILQPWLEEIQTLFEL